MGHLGNKTLDNINKKLHAFFYKKKHVSQANSDLHLKQNNVNSNNISNNSSSYTSVQYAVNLPVQQPVQYVGNLPVQQPVQYAGNLPAQQPVQYAVNLPAQQPVQHAVSLPVRQKTVSLYRGDTRNSNIIFREGFKRWNSSSVIYTSKSPEIAKNYGHGSYYKIKLPENHKLRMRDVGGGLRAVVFSDDIPPEYIKSYIPSKTFSLFKLKNPNYASNADSKPKMEPRPLSP